MADSDASADAADDDGDMTVAEFQTALRDILRSAAAGGVDVRGSWPVEHVSEGTGWDIEITAVAGRTTRSVEEGSVPVFAVVETVAEHKGVPASELPPLYETIEPSVLQRLLDGHEDGEEQTVRFEYLGYDVTVGSDGSVSVEG